MLKVGPIKATFAGEVTLTNLNPPHSYTITGEGKGGIAGFAKGGADVMLVEDGPNATILKYAAKADVGGKMAQLGSRLIESTSKKLAGQFFSTLQREGQRRLAWQPAHALSVSCRLPNRRRCSAPMPPRRRVLR